MDTLKAFLKTALFPLYLGGLVLLSLFASCGGLLTPALAACGENLGHVARVQGAAFAVQGPELRPMEPGALVRRTDVLKTGPNARLELVMLDEARLTLGADTALTLERYDLGRGEGAVLLRLAKGVLRVDQSEQSARREGPFELVTPLGTVSATGQDFWAGFLAEGELSVILLEGRGLSLVNNAGRGEIKYAHHGAVLRSISAPPPAASLWSPERRARAFQTVVFD